MQVLTMLTMLLLLLRRRRKVLEDVLHLVQQGRPAEDLLRGDVIVGDFVVLMRFVGIGRFGFLPVSPVDAVPVDVDVDERVAVLEATVAEVERTGGEAAVHGRSIVPLASVHEVLVAGLERVGEVPAGRLDRIRAGRRWRQEKWGLFQVFRRFVRRYDLAGKILGTCEEGHVAKVGTVDTHVTGVFEVVLRSGNHVRSDLALARTFRGSAETIPIYGRW